MFGWRLRRLFGQEAYPPLTPQQKELMEKFRRGIAAALGVPPEMISEEKLEKWVRHWTAAFVKPTYPVLVGVPMAAQVVSGEELGKMLAELILEAMRGAGRV
jgi:hypothetical protein